MKRNLFFVLTLFLILIVTTVSYAAYPEKPIKVIVAFSPGGGTDTAARTVFKFAEKYSPVPFVIINKPGAAGEIGFTFLAKSKPDGYTIGFINPPTTLIHPILRPNKVKYRLKDFQPIANIVNDPGTLAVRSQSKFKTMKEVMDYIAKHPNKLSIAYGGPGTSEALALEQLEKLAGGTFRKIPFEGTAPAIAALLGGHVDVMISNISEIYNQVQDGKIRVLGVGSSKRISWVPDVPTYKEAGYDVIQVALRGVAAPRGITEEQIKWLEGLIKKVFNDEEFQKKAKEMQLPLQFMGAKEYEEFLIDLDKRLREILIKK